MSLANQGGNSRSHHIHHHQRRRRQTNRFTFMTVAAIVSMSSIPTIFASRGVGASYWRHPGCIITIAACSNA
eukprot:scaffold33367_cov94-Skeletonema_dohrnii-CCMP3373.AAC.1